MKKKKNVNDLINRHEKDDFILKKIDETKKEVEKVKKEKKSKGFNFFWFNKEKPVKLENKNEKDEKEELGKNNDIKEKFKLMQQLKKESSPEEELINSITNTMTLFSSEEPNKNIFNQAKKNIFYKDLNKKIAEAIGKPIIELPKKHTMTKSVTVSNFSKKTKLKYENDGFFNVLDWDKKEIGEKLISISKNLINKVKRREIYKAVFLKKDKEKTSPNVTENIAQFNKLTFFIIQDILSYDFAKDRGKIITKWLKIAEYCKERKDYNDVVAIFSALNNYIISGLKKTYDAVQKEDLFKTIKKFCRYQGNYKKLREDMKSLTNTDYYIPYLGMILKDIAFYEEKAKYIEDKILINFEKLENVQITLSEYFHFQKNIDKVRLFIPEELNFFDNLEEIKESDMEKLASKLEPEFKLYQGKKREKRLTNIDKKYFMDLSVNRPNMKDGKNVLAQKISK